MCKAHVSADATVESVGGSELTYATRVVVA
jgi:hypothetical protein